MYPKIRQWYPISIPSLPIPIFSDTTDFVGKGTFPYPSSSDSNPQVYIESMQSTELVT